MADVILQRDTGRSTRRISWSAIALGVITAMVLQILFAILGTAVGLTAVDTNQPMSRGLTTGAGMWWLITGLMSLFAGGYVAAAMAGLTHNGMLHGAVTWGLNLLVGVTLTALGTGALANAGLSALAATDTAGGRDAVATGRGTLVAGERREAGEQDQEANRTAERADTERSRDAAKKASWWVFLGLLLGAGASLMGGAFGASSDITPRSGRLERAANQTGSSPSDRTPLNHR